MFKTKILSLLILPALLGCQKKTSYQAAGGSTPQFAAEAPSCKSIQQKVIYDSDDRRDWWQTSGLIKNYWAASTVALVQKSRVKNLGSEKFSIDERPYGEQLQLCKNVAFYDQPQGAFCSGFLVAPNLIVTANHCIESLQECQDIHFVFDFAKRTKDQTQYEFHPQDVYSCKSILHADKDRDFAIIELTTDVVGRIPLNIRREGRPDNQDELILIGHPAGLPSKIAGGAHILFKNRNGFYANLDAFSGNSGSLVLGRESGLVEGLLVGGEADYIFENECRRENICRGNECTGEQVVSIQHLKSFIPNRVYQSPQLERCQ